MPAESYKVAFPLLNKELRQAGVGKAPYRDNRHAHAPFYLRRQIGVEARMDRGGSPHKLVFQMNCTGNVQGIGPAFLKTAGDNARIVEIDAARLLVGGIDTAEHGQLIAHAPAYLFQNQARKPHAVLERAAKLI